MARPPVTAEELAGRDHARGAPPLTAEQVEALLRLWAAGQPSRHHPAA
jgi:hypothetical protein